MDRDAISLCGWGQTSPYWGHSSRKRCLFLVLEEGEVLRRRGTAVPRSDPALRHSPALGIFAQQLDGDLIGGRCVAEHETTILNPPRRYIRAKDCSNVNRHRV